PPSASCVVGQVAGRDLARGDELVVPLVHDLHLLILEAELEDRYDVVLHELRGDRAADEGRVLLLAAQDVLLGLHDADLVRPAFRLYGDDVLAAAPIDADIDLVDFDLPHVAHGRAQVVLERVGRDPEEDIDQPVVADLRKERLLVRDRVRADDLGRRVRDLDRHEVGIRTYPIYRYQLERVARASA